MIGTKLIRLENRPSEQVISSASMRVDFYLLRDWEAGNIHIRAQVLWTLTPVPILSIRC